MPNVRHVAVRPPHAGKEGSESRRVLQEQNATAERFGNAMLALAKEGFVPDLVYDHPGWGAGLFVPDIFPDAARISYFEWFYKNRTGAHLPSDSRQPPARFAPNRQRNLYQLDALSACDAAVTPTFWQSSQYPVEYMHKMHILHDGIDADYFFPLGTEASDPEDTRIGELDLAAMPEIVTYATRGLEPLRGFPQFFKSVPRILAERPEAHVVIMADDTVHYGPPREDGKGWGQAMREEVSFDAERVHFLPFSSYEDYRKLLRASSVHVYLTAPFVLSWSLLEAMSCGCLVVASDTAPVREVVRHAENGILTDFRSEGDIAQWVVTALRKKAAYADLRAAARKTVMDRFDLKKLLYQHLHLIQDTIARKVSEKYIALRVREQSNAH